MGALETGLALSGFFTVDDRSSSGLVTRSESKCGAIFKNKLKLFKLFSWLWRYESGDREPEGVVWRSEEAGSGL